MAAWPPAHDENVAQTSCLHAGWKPALRRIFVVTFFITRHKAQIDFILSTKKVSSQ